MVFPILPLPSLPSHLRQVKRTSLRLPSPRLLPHQLRRKSHQLLPQFHIIAHVTPLLHHRRRTYILSTPIMHRRRIHRALRALELILLERLQHGTHAVSHDRERLVDILRALFRRHQARVTGVEK